jgi:hypothetical protein
MDLTLPTTSALNLTLEGSVGTFRIGGSGPGAPRSIQVRYLETHIGFDPSVASNETMLRHLEPVRETFDFQALDFDQIMQRDIDDARVSTELIPYLLDAGSGGTIKFFPPVVIVAVPVEDLGGGRPLPLRQPAGRELQRDPGGAQRLRHRHGQPAGRHPAPGRHRRPGLRRDDRPRGRLRLHRR